MSRSFVAAILAVPMALTMASSVFAASTPSYKVLDDGKAIVVKHSDANPSSLRALGAELNSKNDRAWVFIFDDEKAARLRQKVFSGSASKAEERLYDAHFVAVYKKNPSTSYNQLDIHLHGLDGKTESVKF